jgi:hypothetical protein
MSIYARFLVFCLVLFLAGCRSNEQSSKVSSGSELKPESAHPSKEAPAAVASDSASLKFTPPDGWIAETPASSSRKAQYKLPRVSGDPEDAEMVVFYFQGGGGTPQANVERWISQFQNPDGSPAGSSAQHRSIHNIPVTTVDVKGNYTGSMTMSMQKGQSGTKEHFRMLGAIAETANGPWFFKLTGPEKTVAKWEPSFEKFLESMQAGE